MRPPTRRTILKAFVRKEYQIIYNDPIPQAQQGPISLEETLGEFIFKQSQPIILFRKSLKRRTPANLEPSERDIGELS